jgi:hypothetical protein
MRRPSALAPLLLALAFAAGTARAEPRGPLFEHDTFPDPGYELRLSAAYHWMAREDFRQLVFLVAQPIRRIEVWEQRSELDLRISITRKVALQAVLPLTVRSADLELQDVVVSRTQVLRGQTVTIDGAGMADPTLALGTRALDLECFRLNVDIGTRIPIDDNPGSPVLPRALPLGTGQSMYFIGASTSARAGRLGLALGYRFEYSPGSTATYLVREVSRQGYTSGALDVFLAHRVSAEVEYALNDDWSARIAPDFRVDQQPSVVERSGATAFLADAYRYELVFEASLQARLGEHHALRLGWSQPLLFGWDDDPFFPIQVPEQGPRLTWLVRAR